ncbi:patatin-like phospholipase family protein [Moorena producens]|uniref:patatin-like phospholipase family protein n=1 Tax=Moorena producens TaxID=1155739 RepID=UPI003C7279EE
MTFKILSLDGGGMRGVISARILQDIEKTIKEKYGQELHEYFDLISGTSTGSILAAGIACKMNGEDLIKLYNKEGKNIFLKSTRYLRKLRELSKLFGRGVLYPHEFPDKSEEQGLANVLKRNLVDPDSRKPLTMRDIKDLQLLILSYDVFTRNTTWFGNNDPSGWYIENDIPLWQICTASASAPTFFPPYQLLYKPDEENPKKKYRPHIDGGVSANNPVLAAIAHAISMKDEGKQNKTKIDDIAVLSIGTGTTTRPYTYDEVNKWGQLGWVSHLPDMFLDPDAENSEHIALRMFRGIGRQKYLRLNFEINTYMKEKNCFIKLWKPLIKINKYIHQYNLFFENIRDKKKEKLNEDIDNYEAFKELKFAAECYLEYGTVDYKNADNDKDIAVRDAIDKFIYNHPPDHKK